ncbi:hypothetical protein Ccrd_026220, partial [Cynara cardunculus var. scolymus]
MWGLDLKKTILWRVSLLRRCARSLWHQILACWIGKSIRYRHLLHSGSGPLIPTSHRCPRRPRTTTAMDVATVYHQFPSVEMTASSGDGFASGEMTSSCGGSDHDKEGSDLVALKISLLGDQYIGKTSFLGEHAHGEEEECSGEEEECSWGRGFWGGEGVKEFWKSGGVE